jgi:hypothetical protein
MSTIRRHLRGLATLGLSALRTRSRRHDTAGRPPSPGVRTVVRHEGVRHEGATERFGAELRAMRHMDVSPELISDIETELRWGLIWYEFERSMQAEIDKAFAPYLDAMTECADFDDLRDLVGLAEAEPLAVAA